MCYLSIYETSVPSSAQIFIDQFRRIIKFDVLKPDPLIQVFYPEFSIKAKILGTKIPINKSQENNILLDLEVYIMCAVAVVIWLIVMAIVYSLLKKYRAKIKELLIAKKEAFLFNGYLRSVYVSYIEMCLTVGF